MHPTITPLEVRGFALPDDTYYGTVAWLADGRFVVDGIPVGSRVVGNGTLSVLDPRSGDLEPLAVPGRDGCRAQEPERPFLLGDGRLGYVNFCLGVGRDETFTVFAVEPGTATAERLGATGSYNPSHLTATPDLARITFGHSSGICAGIGLAGKAGPQLVEPTTAGSGAQAFRIDQALTVEPCDSTGRANEPSSSPDGTRTALFVSPASVGVEGFARLDSPWQLAIMPASGGAPLTVVVDDLSRPTGLAWSPDGDWIAYSLGSEGTDPGTYLVEVATDRVLMVATDVLRGPVWSHDGRSIAGLTGGNGRDTSIATIDVHSVTGPS